MTARVRATIGAVLVEEVDASLDEGSLVAIDLARDAERAAAFVRLSERTRGGEPDAIAAIALRLRVGPEADAEILGEEDNPSPGSAGAAPLVHLLLEGLESAGSPLAIANESAGWVIAHLGARRDGAAAVPIGPGASALLEVDRGALVAMRI